MSGNNYYFELEEHLQDHCIAVLQQKGIPCNKELYLNGLRADIVTPDAVIECKKILTRDAIWQAYGQAREYADRTGKPRVIIVGQSPNSEKALNVAMCTADQLKGKAEISFVDSDPYWQLLPEVPDWTVPETDSQPSYTWQPWTAKDTSLDVGDALPWFIGFIVVIGILSSMAGGRKPQEFQAVGGTGETLCVVGEATMTGCGPKIVDVPKDRGTIVRDKPNGINVGTATNGFKVTVTAIDGKWCKITQGWTPCQNLRKD